MCIDGLHIVEVAGCIRRTGDGCNVAGARHYFTNRGIAEVRDEDVAKSIDEDGIRLAQVSACSEPPVATRQACTSAARIVVNTDNGLDVAGTGDHFTNDRIFCIGNEDVAGAVDEDTFRLIESGAGSRTAVAGVAAEGAVPGHDGHDARRGNLDDLISIKVGVRNIGIAGGIEGNAFGKSDAGAECRRYYWDRRRRWC